MTAGNPQSSTQPGTSWHAEELGRLVEPALNFVEVQRRAHDKEPRMTRGETASRWMLVAGLTVALTASSGRGYAEAAEPTPARGRAVRRSGSWATPTTEPRSP